MDMTPYTWDSLATLGGASAATLLIVQFLKAPLDKIWKIPTRWFAWLIAFVILLIANVVTKGFSWADLPLLLVNAFLVTFAAMGAYEATFATGDRQKAAAAASKTNKGPANAPKKV